MEQKIKAGDLRIGNLIDHSFNGIVKVNGIHPSLDKLHIDCVKEQGEGKKAWRDIKEFSPIPLTEEWLVRFGFEYDDEFEGNVYDSDLGVSIGVSGDITYFMGNLETMWTDVLQETKYVNQLQNLYFALTGEELTLNDK